MLYRNIIILVPVKYVYSKNMSLVEAILTHYRPGNWCEVSSTFWFGIYWSFGLGGFESCRSSSVRWGDSQLPSLTQTVIRSLHHQHYRREVEVLGHHCTHGEMSSSFMDLDPIIFRNKSSARSHLSYNSSFITSISSRKIGWNTLNLSRASSNLLIGRNASAIRDQIL